MTAPLMFAFWLMSQNGYEAKLEEAQHLFYNDQFDEAEFKLLEARTMNPQDPASYEKRSFFLYLRVQRLLDLKKSGSEAERFRACESCPALKREFDKEVEGGLARISPSYPDRDFMKTRLELNRMLFAYKFEGRGGLGMLNALRASRAELQRILGQSPGHARAKIALAWIEFSIGDDWKGRWFLGGSKKDAFLLLSSIAACRECHHDDKVEAEFSQWALFEKDERYKEASEVARKLLLEFPGNAAMRRFAEKHGKK